MSAAATTGCHQFDTWIDAEAVPRYWGTYTLANGTGVIKMPYGEIPIQVHATHLVLTTNHADHKFAKLPPVDGARFLGRYALSERDGTTPTISFTANGVFDDAGALDILNHQTGYPVKITAAPGRGTYAVKDHTVTFTYDDGRTYQAAFPGIGYDNGNPSPATLTMSYNDDVLTKQ